MRLAREGADAPPLAPISTELIDVMRIAKNYHKCCALTPRLTESTLIDRHQFHPRMCQKAEHVWDKPNIRRGWILQAKGGVVSNAHSQKWEQTTQLEVSLCKTKNVTFTKRLGRVRDSPRLQSCPNDVSPISGLRPTNARDRHHHTTQTPSPSIPRKSLEVCRVCQIEFQAVINFVCVHVETTPPHGASNAAFPDIEISKVA